MTRSALTALAFSLLTTVASAQTTQPVPPAGGGSPIQIMTSLPADTHTVNRWYKQNVYDPSDNKIGEVLDVLVDRSGKAAALVVGVGGFLGMGEKDVVVPFNAVQFKRKDNNAWYAVMNTTKEALKTAPGFKYDRNTMIWTLDGAPSTTGTQTSPRPQAK